MVDNDKYTIFDGVKLVADVNSIVFLVMVVVLQ